MERIAQNTMPSLIIKPSNDRHDVILIIQFGDMVGIEKQSIPALIEVLKKYIE